MSHGQARRISNKRRSAAAAVFALTIGILAAVILPWTARAESPESEDAQQAVYKALLSGKRSGELDREYKAPAEPTVYLTFDDGPSKYTPQVLDILQREGIKGTFFALGEQVKEYPDYAKRIVQEGHALGNHSYNHVYKQLYSSFSSFWEQVLMTDDIFYQTIGQRSRLLRAPGGTATNFDGFYYYYLNQAGFTVHDWNIDSGDASRAGVKAEEIFSMVNKSPLRHELIVLMHDGAGHEETVKALPQMISFFKEKGYAFAALTEEVKPFQFGITKLKWSRGMSYDKFKEYSRNVAQYRAAQGPEAVSHPPAQSAKRVKPDRPVQVKLDGTSFVLPPEQYLFQRGAFYVPLRTLVEQMGGTVDWNNEERIATANCGLYKLHYDLVYHSIQVDIPGKPVQIYSLADMQMQDGMLMVPLRQTAEWLGAAIMDYDLQSSPRHVSIAAGNGYYLHIGRIVPFYINRLHT